MKLVMWSISSWTLFAPFFEMARAMLTAPHHPRASAFICVRPFRRCPQHEQRGNPEVIGSRSQQRRRGIRLSLPRAKVGVRHARCIRTEGHCFGTLRRPRDNRQPIANLDDMAAAMDLVQAAYAFE